MLTPHRETAGTRGGRQSLDGCPRVTLPSRQCGEDGASGLREEDVLLLRILNVLVHLRQQQRHRIACSQRSTEW